MRLRQAHAILEAGTALMANGFELHPFDYDNPGLVDYVSDDYLTGYAEFHDPDHPRDHTRTYNIDLKPGPDDDTIEVYLLFGYGADAPCLLYSKARVAPADRDDLEFRGRVGTEIAERVAEEVRKNEQPYRDEYERRTA
ncbi:hypothetical protein OG552_10805 [Streptomyces sp. NBC_01476]|uniref:hypothetical protein n=1 Tax=Streptomyces sp. NBC_01476 TaxID=2903881 RepID=UPI002E30BDF5|nr:hypothetical protein [Streptomyces sp. NBC_01476]